MRAPRLLRWGHYNRGMMKKLLVALALLLSTTATIAPASLRRTVRRQNHAHRVMCYTSCPFYRDRCRTVFANGCLFKRCLKEMVYSCLGNPADVQCARPCSQLNPCPGGQQCGQGQCIIQPPPVKCAQLPPLKRPKPPTREACGTIFCPRGTPYCDHGTSTCVANPPGGCPARRSGRFPSASWGHSNRPCRAPLANSSHRAAPKVVPSALGRPLLQEEGWT